MTYRWLSPDDIGQQFTVFKAINAAGKLVARPHLADLACDWCGKVDEEKSLHRPITLGVRIRARRDVVCSFDLQDLISIKLADVLNRLAPGKIETYPILDNPAYLAVAPTTVLVPSRSDPAFEFSDQCGKCRRWRDAVCKAGRPPPHSVNPAIPSGLDLAAFRLESRIGRSLKWFVSSSLAAELQKMTPAFKGLCFNPHELPAQD